MQYTIKEKTEKRYTLQDVIKAIKSRVNGPYCSNELSGFNENSRFTLVELNDLVDSVVYDTLI